MPRRLLVTGGSGLVGGNVCFLASDGWEVLGTYRRNRPSLPGIQWHHMELTNPKSVREALSELRPDVVVHTAAMADIDACEAQPDLAWKVNVLGTQNVSLAAASLGSRLVHLSTSNVFDGKRGNYTESDQTNPINRYAETKIAAEAEALSFPGNVIIRTSIVLGFPKTDGRSFLRKTVDSLRRGDRISLPVEEIRSPIDVWTLSRAILELAQGSYEGILHIAGTEFISRHRMGVKIAAKLGIAESRVVPVRKPPPGRAPRPMNVTLNTAKARSILKTDLPDCDGAIERAFALAEKTTSDHSA